MRNWSWHGETPLNIGSSIKRARIENVYDENEDTHLIDMINDAEDHFVDCPDNLTKILEEAEKPIYLGLNIMRLSFSVKMYNLKTRNGWKNNGLSQLLSLLGDVLPKDNNISNSIYKAKKML